MEDEPGTLAMMANIDEEEGNEVCRMLISYFNLVHGVLRYD